ncbi:MAG: hypothetical protein RIQ33_807 [Bacteroidota bacterium]
MALLVTSSQSLFAEKFICKYSANKFSSFLIDKSKTKFVATHNGKMNITKYNDRFYVEIDLPSGGIAGTFHIIDKKYDKDGSLFTCKSDDGMEVHINILKKRTLVSLQTEQFVFSAFAQQSFPKK